MALPEELKIRDTDLCIVIGNLLKMPLKQAKKEENKKNKIKNKQK